MLGVMLFSLRKKYFSILQEKTIIGVKKFLLDMNKKSLVKNKVYLIRKLF